LKRSLLLVTASLIACLPFAVRAVTEERDAVVFQHWRSEHAKEVRDFETYLVAEELAHVAPAYQLLRSASMWKECKGQPFAVPPQKYWNDVKDVLRLLQELRAQNVLGEFEVVSAYRDEKLNRCSGGSKRSSHMRFAVDILPLKGDYGPRLCKFWADHGKAWNMGLSRYPTGRIHIDRTGWRTWGKDYTRNTSFCFQRD
jgi:uncharacterized protein YcbK (DUF882 family)